MITKLSYDGKGIIKDGKITFVKKVLPNEEVKYHLVKEGKHFNIGEVDEIVKKSKDRVPSFCPYSNKCGGCSYDITSYENSLKIKKNNFLDLCKHHGLDIDDITVISSRPVLGYRNKISLKVFNYEFGYYEEESHRFVPIKKCYLANEAINNVLEHFSLFSFKEGSLTIRSNSFGEILLVITTKEELKIKEELVTKHLIKGIVWNNQVVYGVGFLNEVVGNVTYKIPYQSFFQVNKYISEQISLELLQLINKNDQVLDLYCGVGFFSFQLASKGTKVTGIEENKPAIISALENKKINNINNISFHAGKVEDIISKLPNDYTKVIVDPPRAGLKRSVIASIHSDYLIYISCNPITFVRDLLLLTNYKLMSIKLFDMFPYTSKIEVFCVLKKISIN